MLSSQPLRFMRLNKIFTFNKRILVVFAILFLTLPAFYKLIRPGFFPMYDDMQVVRLHQMDLCIRDGQIPCRWVPDLGYGYGYPLFEYYAPLPYYIMEVFHLADFSFISSVKIGFILSIFLSATFFYLLARQFFPRLVSLVVTTLYVYTPVRASDLYVRGAMGELWGMVTLPLILYALENTARKKDKSSVLLLSIAVFLFLISHNLTLIMSSLLILFWVVFILYRYRKNWEEIAKPILIGGLIGVLMASFYILPLVFERNLVYLETTTQGYFNYLAHFANLRQLFTSRIWGYGPSVLGPSDDVSFSTGQLHTALLVISGFLLMLRRRYKERIFFLGLFVLNFFYLFLTHERSTFIWKAIPALAYIQFPWRFLLLSSLISSLVAGFSLTVLKGIKSIAASLTIILLTIYLYTSFFIPYSKFKCLNIAIFI